LSDDDTRDVDADGGGVLAMPVVEDAVEDGGGRIPCERLLPTCRVYHQEAPLVIMKLRPKRPTVPPMMILALLLAKVVNHPPACFSSSLMVALVASAVVECVDEGGWRVEEEE